MPDLEGKCFMRVVRGSKSFLAPADVHALDWLEQIPRGREIIIISRRPRSPQHHRWFFAMLRKVCEATGNWAEEEELLEALKDATGHYKIAYDLYGAKRKRLKSINFAAMGQDEFKAFALRAIELIAIHTGIDAEALMREVDEEQGGRPWQNKVSAA